MKKSKFKIRGSCELRYDMHWHGRKPCEGEIRKVAGVRLCERHRILVAAIGVDAIADGTYANRRRHPVRHRGSAAA